MAKIGLSKPYFALYSASGTTVTYSGGGLLGKYTECNLSIDAADNNDLYADNAIAESDKRFGGGTFTLSTASLDALKMKTILGATQETSSDWVDFDDDQVIPYIGLGGIIKKRVSGADKWAAFVLPKTQLQNPGFAVVTQGETINWQVDELTATVMRDDTANHVWQKLSEDQDTEAAAETLIKTFFSIT